MLEREALRGAEPRTGQEARLVRGLREGEAEAQAELYDRFAPGLYRFAVARLRGDVQTAEEVVIETLVAAVHDLRRFSPATGSFSAWLYGIARRRLLLERRRQARRKSVPREAQAPLAEAAPLPDDTDLAARTAERLEAQRRIEMLAGVLTDLELEALILSGVQELSVREIGQAIRRSESAVHSLLHHARQKARERWAQDE